MASGLFGANLGADVFGIRHPKRKARGVVAGLGFGPRVGSHGRRKAPKKKPAKRSSGMCHVKGYRVAGYSRKCRK